MQRFHSPIVEFSLAHPRFILLTILAITLVLTAGMVRVKVDTDPENMLPGSDETRVLNQSIREEFAVTDMIAVGIVEDSGLLTPERLTAVSNLVLEIEALENVPEGVSSFRNLSDLSTGELNEDDVAAVAAAAAANPALAERLVTADGNGLAIFVPLESKDDAASVASSIRSMSAGLGLPDTTEFYIGGLPLAEDTFGRDMLIQMGLLAPLSGFAIFLLLLFLFRRLLLTLVALALAMVTVIWSMGLLIAAGFPVHIMSSMIPIFLMPIAILDTVHVMSEVSDRYTEELGKKATIRLVLKELFPPITFTTITTAVAFASLALAPIPPVQVFGLFIALGVIIAWLLTLTMLRAAAGLISSDRLAQASTGIFSVPSLVLAAGVRRVGSLARSRAWLIVVLLIGVALAAAPGLTKINVNDNPRRQRNPSSDRGVWQSVFRRV